MKFEVLVKNILFKKSQGKDITASDFPDKIYFPSELTKALKKIQEMTHKESGFSKRTSGAGGYEHAINTAFFIDELYIGGIMGGDYKSVTPFERINAKPEQINESKVRYDFEFGDKTIKTKTYEIQSLPKPLLFGLVASFHTHPRFYHSENLTQYTFFSSQDIASLLQMQGSILGLVAGNSVWLACKTNNSISIYPEVLQQATQIELNEGMEGVKKFVKSNMKQFQIIFYEGSLGSAVQRL